MGIRADYATPVKILNELKVTNRNKSINIFEDLESFKVELLVSSSGEILACFAMKVLCSRKIISCFCFFDIVKPMNQQI